MIRITVELFNARKNGERSVLGIMDICNTGESDDPRIGHYTGRLYRKGKEFPGPNDVTRWGKVENFPRHSYVVWRLVMRMLRDMFPEEKNG